ncbi:uncharacterized protein [Littorina saxatilis]|uniref:uncharacterized protein n=1 Tax=Littorina saxatilis TaxID=31220 RepID=UPI0038B513E2
MAWHVCHVLWTILLCLLQKAQSLEPDGPTDIKFTPATLTLTPSASDGDGGIISIGCRAISVVEDELMTGMKVERVLHTSPNADPVTIAAASPPLEADAVLTQTSFQGSAKVFGSLREKKIFLTLYKVNCDDAGMIICTATSEASSAYKTYQASQNLTIEVSPGTLTLTAQPSGVSDWTSSDTLTIRCDGIVGTVKNQYQIQWTWEYQDTATQTSGEENWKPYHLIGHPATDINTGSLVPTANPCYKRQTSTLTRRLTGSDTGRQYRCFVINREVSSRGVGPAQVLTIGTVTEIPSTERNATETDERNFARQQGECPDIGVILGGLIPAIVVLDLAFLAVIINCFKQRMQRPATQTNSRETYGKDNQMTSFSNVSRTVGQRPVEQRPIDQRPVEQRPVEQRPVEPCHVEQRHAEQPPVKPCSVEQDSSTDDKPTPFDVLIIEDEGAAVSVPGGDPV